MGLNKKRQAPGGVIEQKFFSALFLVVLISFLVYLPVLNNKFVNWDDPLYVQNNPLIHTINPGKFFSGNVMGNYHPLTMLVYSVEYYFFGLNEKAYHAVNLILHLINSILVFYVILFLSNKFEVAFVVSLLFGIHPIHVESVAWVAELKDLLYAFFFLASYLCYLNYLKSGKRKFYFYCLLLFVLSLFSKAMAVSLPLLLLLTDYFKGRKTDLKTLLEKAPFFVLSLIFGVVAVVAQRSAGAMHDINDADNFTFFQHCIFACYSFITYVQKILLPFRFSAYYPYPLKTDIPGLYYAYVLFFVALCTGIFYLYMLSIRHRREGIVTAGKPANSMADNAAKIVFGIDFFAVTVFIVLQLLPVGGAMMADRYTYIPSIGIFYLAGEAFYWLWERKNGRVPASILLVAVVIFLSLKTQTRCRVWKNSLTLWNDVIDQYQTVSVAYNNRVLVFEEENRTDEALRDYNKLIELDNSNSQAHNNRGSLLMNENKFDEALEDFNKAIALKPDYHQAYYNRAKLYGIKKRYEEALRDYNKAIELKPDDADAYNNRGIIFKERNMYNEALADYNKAIELNDSSYNTYYNRAFLFVLEKKYDLALDNYTKCIGLHPGFAEAYGDRGNIFMSLNKNDEAMNDYSKAIQLKPDLAQPYFNRAIIEANKGEKAAACRDFQKADSLGVQQAAGLYDQLCR